MNKNFRTHRMVESALMIALAIVLSFSIIFRLPFGGSITLCCMLPIILVSYRYGIKWGLTTAFAFSLVQALQGVAEGTFTAAALGVDEATGVYTGGFFTGSHLMAVAGIVLLDYILAFTVIGLAGLFRGRFSSRPALGVVCGTLFVGVLRYLCHVLSGAIFFGIWGEWFFTQDGFPAWGQQLVAQFPGSSLYFIYSIIYNAFFLVPEVLLTAIVGYLLVKGMPKLAAPVAAPAPAQK